MYYFIKKWKAWLLNHQLRFMYKMKNLKSLMGNQKRNSGLGVEERYFDPEERRREVERAKRKVASERTEIRLQRLQRKGH